MVFFTPKFRTVLAWSLVCVGVVSVSRAGERASGEQYQSPSEERAVRKAAALIGGSEAANLTLVRELQLWRRRALEAEARAHSADAHASASGGVESDAKEAEAPCRLEVVSILAADRVLILSQGRNFGVFEGALVRLESGAVAKVIEARRGCCAAVLENSFRGNVSALEGQRGQIMVR